MVAVGAYQLVHQLPGRVRVRIPGLQQDSALRLKLRYLLSRESGQIRRINLNPHASSLTLFSDPAVSTALLLCELDRLLDHCHQLAADNIPETTRQSLKRSTDNLAVKTEIVVAESLLGLGGGAIAAGVGAVLLPEAVGVAICASTGALVGQVLAKEWLRESLSAFSAGAEHVETADHLMSVSEALGELAGGTLGSAAGAIVGDLLLGVPGAMVGGALFQHVGSDVGHEFGDGFATALEGQQSGTLEGQQSGEPGHIFALGRSLRLAAEETVLGSLFAGLGLLLLGPVGALLGVTLGEELAHKYGERFLDPGATNTEVTEPAELAEITSGSIGEVSGELAGELVGEAIGEVLLGNVGAEAGAALGEKIGEELGKFLGEEVIEVSITEPVATLGSPDPAVQG